MRNFFLIGIFIGFIFLNIANASENVFSFITFKKTITIDGNFDDWDIQDRIYSDPDGPECNNAPGQDIQEIYVCQDDNYIYLRYILNGPLNESFGYKFGENLHVFVGQTDGQGRIFFANGPDIPDSFVSIVNNQFECKFYKNDVLSWKNKSLRAWCDQGYETVCRDYISLDGVVKNAISWMYVQQRNYENKNNLNILGFGIQYADGHFPETGNIATEVKLYDNNEQSVTLSNLRFWSDDNMGGNYDAKNSKWNYNNFAFESGYVAEIVENLVQGIYKLEVTLSNGYIYERTYEFNSLISLPVISSASFTLYPNTYGDVLWRWGISAELCQISSNHQTSIRANINIYSNEQYVASVSIETPTHLGCLFIPNEKVQQINSKGNQFGLVVMLRTNDNNNRTFSDEIQIDNIQTKISNTLCDINNDGITGLPEAIHALQILAGIRN